MTNNPDLCPCCDHWVVRPALCASCPGLKGNELEAAVIRVLKRLGATEVAPLPTKIREALNVFQSLGPSHGPDGVLGIDGTGGEARMWLVLEVKGTDKRGAELKDLRQLDEWVYLCSPDEHVWRQRNIASALGFPGQWTIASTEWPPVRGVFVMNNCVKQAPDHRPDPFADDKVKCYAKLHELCLVRWIDLLSFHPPALSPSRFLRQIFSTAGPLETPPG